MQIVVRARNQTWSFEAEPGEKILHAGLRSGVDLRYECSTGTCATCRARLVGGEVEYSWPEAPARVLLKPERNEILMCQCFARSDCSLDVAGDIQALAPDACTPARYSGVISGCQRLTHDVALLAVALDRPMAFEAGQFALVEAPGVPGARAYSMVNYQRPTATLWFVIKQKPGGGFTEWLFNHDPLDTTVKVLGPLGHATFEPGIAQNLLCIVGGTGIAGIMSILARACDERYFDQFRGDLFFGVRTPQDVFFLDELRAFQRRFPASIRITVALSDAPSPPELEQAYPEFSYAVGLVHEVAARAIQGLVENVMAYVAGPPPMVEATMRMLVLQARLSPRNIRYDKFS